MEVHTHTRNPDSHREKKWSHYFWEFLMLFLAVFCGFLAEYQLEHVIEHQREKEYAYRLYEDTKSDTSVLKRAMGENNSVTAKIDSFRVMVQTQILSSFPTGMWYYYGRFGTRVLRVALQDATMQQLKSSGGLRYFKKDAVVDAIARYDHACKEMQTMLAIQDLTYNDIIKARNKIFNSFFIDEIMRMDIPQEKIDSFKNRTMPLLSNQQDDFIQYANLCQLRSYNNKTLLIHQQQAYNKAEILLAELKKVYDLK
jgi:hypothetical protein